MASPFVSFGTIPDERQLCKLLHHDLFGHPLNWPGYGQRINGVFNWDPKQLSLQWLRDRGRNFGMSDLDLNQWTQPVTEAQRQAEQRVFACLQVLSKEDATRVLVIMNYFLNRSYSNVAQVACLNQQTKKQTMMLPNGRIVEQDVTIPRPPCISFGRSVLYSPIDRLTLMLSLQEAHPSLSSIFDLANRNALERSSEFETAQARNLEEQRVRQAAAEEASRKEETERNKPESKLISLYQDYLAVKACYESREGYLVGYINNAQMNKARSRTREKEQFLLKNNPALNSENAWKVAAEKYKGSMIDAIIQNPQLSGGSDNIKDFEQIKLMCSLSLQSILSDDGNSASSIKKDF